MGALSVTRIGPGVYSVDQDGRTHTVYVAGPATDRWAFWNGQVFRVDSSAVQSAPEGAHAGQPLVAPLPARVVKIHVRPGMPVTKGSALLLLEAMKMELPIRAPADAVVAAVHCREGELVQAGAVLVEFEVSSDKPL
jgi:3-methylcrotonyl-CoA carboxylase alpha subunit